MGECAEPVQVCVGEGRDRKNKIKTHDRFLVLEHYYKEHGVVRNGSELAQNRKALSPWGLTDASAAGEASAMRWGPGFPD